MSAVEMCCCRSKDGTGGKDRCEGDEEFSLKILLLLRLSVLPSTKNLLRSGRCTLKHL